MNLPVVILAGGLGTRLRPITEKIPKVLVPVAGKPFLVHQLSLLRSQGIRHVVLCLAHLGDLVVKEFGNGQALDMLLEYSFDGPLLLGTGGAIRRALPKLGESFFVLNGDSYLPSRMAPALDCFERSGKRGLMMIFKNNNRWDTSNVIYRNGRILTFDKEMHLPEMAYIDYGLSLFRASVFQEWPEGQPFDLSEVNKNLIAQNELAGFEADERFYEVGSHSGLAELDALLRQVSSTRNDELGGAG